MMLLNNFYLFYFIFTLASLDRMCIKKRQKGKMCSYFSVFIGTFKQTGVGEGQQQQVEVSLYACSHCKIMALNVKLKWGHWLIIKRFGYKGLR